MIATASISSVTVKARAQRNFAICNAWYRARGALLRSFGIDNESIRRQNDQVGFERILKTARYARRGIGLHQIATGYSRAERFPIVPHEPSVAPLHYRPAEDQAQFVQVITQRA